MAVLQSKLNPRSEEFKSNAAAMRALVDDLNARLARIVEGGGAEARAAEVAMAAVIEACVRLDDTERALLRSLSDLTLRNWNGIEVGALRASAQLRNNLGSLGATT